MLHHCQLAFYEQAGEPVHKNSIFLWNRPESLLLTMVQYHRGFKEHELNQIPRLVEEYEQILLEAWHDYFGT